MNKVVLVGRLTRDPEVRYSQGDSATAVARYTVAVDRRFKRDGEPTADFIPCVVFGRSAEFAEKYFRQGMRISVSGRIGATAADQLLESCPISFCNDLRWAVFAADIEMAVNSGCWDACFFHELPYKLHGVLKRFLIVISALHAHFHTEAVPVAISAEQVAVSVVDANVPASAAMRRGLVGSISIVHVVVCRHVLEITVMLRFGVCSCIGTCCEVVGVMYNNTLWVVVRIGVLAADV